MTLEHAWMNRNIMHLEETLGIIRRGSYFFHGREIKLEHTEKEHQCAIYYDEDLVRSLAAAKQEDHAAENCPPCRCQVVNQDSFAAALDLAEECGDDERVLVLNFANAFHPGGGVRRGAKAQEEDLCRQSTLLCSLESEQASVYYERHWASATCLATDAMLLSPWVEVFRGSRGELLEYPRCVSVLTCAAPMLCEDTEDMEEGALRKLLFDRIIGILRVAQNEGYRNLVLGAWGCGAFGNDASMVAEAFQKALSQIDASDKNVFQRITFAIKDSSWDRYNFNCFAYCFGNER